VKLKRRNSYRIVETGKSDFGHSVYGLTIFQLILIRNYIFIILVHLYLFLKIAQPFHSFKGDTWEGSTAILSYSKAVW